MLKSSRTGTLAALFLLVLTAKAWANESVTLGSGKSIEILSVGPMTFGSGQKALMLKYRTAIPIDDVISLRKEADEIWDRFVVDVEHAGYQQAIISANAPEVGSFISYNKSYNFIYEQKDHAWRTLEADAKEKTKLDEESVKQFMDRLDWIHDHNEMNAFLLYFAKNWVGALASPTGQVTVNREQLAQGTYNNLKTTKDYHHLRQILGITISPDGTSAQIDSREIEDGVIDGKPTKMVSKSTDFIEDKDSNIVFTKSTSEQEK